MVVLLSATFLSKMCERAGVGGWRENVRIRRESVKPSVW